MIPKDTVKGIVDGFFAALEARVAGHPLQVAALEFIRREADSLGVDELAAWLASKGLPIIS